MAETITLPKSGIVLTKQTIFEDRGEDWSDVTGCARLYVGGTSLRAYCIDQSEDFRERSEALAWLDARVLELRAALLPADARERVARAIYEERHPSAEWAHATNAQIREHLRYADAVLAALGGKP